MHGVAQREANCICNPTFRLGCLELSPAIVLSLAVGVALMAVGAVYINILTHQSFYWSVSVGSMAIGGLILLRTVFLIVGINLEKTTELSSNCMLSLKNWWRGDTTGGFTSDNDTGEKMFRADQEGWGVGPQRGQFPESS